MSVETPFGSCASLRVLRARATRCVMAAGVTFAFSLGVESASAQPAQPKAQAGGSASQGDTVLLAATERVSTSAPVSTRPATTKTDKANEREQRAATLKAAREALQGSDPVAMEQAFGALAKLGGKDAAEPVIARLRRGLPPQLIDTAIEALVELKQPSAVPLFVELTGHRRWQVREQAVVALAALKAKSAQQTLLSALDDPSPEVREAAARALGEVGDARASAALWTAHECGVANALVAIGRVGGTKDAEQLAKRAQEACVAVLPAYTVMLTRKNLPAGAKVKLVTALGEAKTPESAACLKELHDGIGKDLEPGVRTLLARAVQSADSSGANVTALAQGAKP